ncbi:MAG: hypothetical protein EXS37_03895 [Opitutus sp.]|nr:hypothetical protein [Opitutus sp.]
MSNFDAEGGSENQWEDRGELAWNEFDWERYLREQDVEIERYLRFYESDKTSADRIDRVAEKMNWGQADWSEDGLTAESEVDEADDPADDDPDEVYTLHKNPVFITTKAIYLSLGRSWQTLAADAANVPQPMAVALLVSLHRGEEQAVQAIHALDFGDYAMAVSLFKRALGALNNSLALVSVETEGSPRRVQTWRTEAISRLFDLREVWLRVISECRGELEAPVDDEEES